MVVVGREEWAAVGAGGAAAVTKVAQAGTQSYFVRACQYERVCVCVRMKMRAEKSASPCPYQPQNLASSPSAHSCHSPPEVSSQA